MNAKLKLLQIVLLFALSVCVSGCLNSARQNHLLNPKAVYTAPPEGIAIKDGGLLYGEGTNLVRITGASRIPAGWLLIAPE